MKRQFILLLSIFAALFAVFGLAACDGEKETHHWASEWSHTLQSHWHFCTDEDCDAHGDEAPHEFVLKEYVEGQEPTCYTRGKGVFVCSVCGVEKEDTAEATGAHVFEGEWLSRDDVHYRVCSTTGCRAEQTEPHSDPLIREFVRPAEAFSDGLVQYRCSICQNVVREERIYATSIPVSFNVGVSLKRNGSAWADDDVDPVVTVSSNGRWGDVSLVRDPDTSVSYQFNYRYTNGKNGNGDPCGIAEFSLSTQSGVRKYLFDETTGRELGELTSMYTNPVTCFDSVLRVKVSNDQLILFRFYYNGESIAEFYLRIHIVSYAQYRALYRSEDPSPAMDISLPPRKEDE